MTIVNPD